MVLGNANGSIILFHPLYYNTYDFHKDEITRIISSSKGDFIITGGSLGILHKFVIASGEVFRLPRHTAKISAISISSKDSMLVTGCVSGKIQLINMRNRKCLNSLDVAPISNLRISSSENCLFVGTCDNKLSIWNLTSFTAMAVMEDVQLFKVVGSKLWIVSDKTVSLLANPLKVKWKTWVFGACLLYTSDAADE